MSETNRFGLGRVTEKDRCLAADKIEHARSTGEYDSAEAARRLARVRVASTHSALQVAVTGRTGATVPPILEVAPRIAGALWAVIAAVDIVVWLFIGVFSGQWDPSWLLWVLFGGGVIAAGVRGIRDRDRQLRAAGDGNP